MGRSENSSFSDLLNLCTICNQSFDQGQLIVHQNEAHHVTLDKTKGAISTETAGPEQNDDDNGQLTDDDVDDLGDDDHNYDNEEEVDSDDDGSSMSSWGSATTIDDDDDSMDLEDFPLVTKDADFVNIEEEEDSIGKIMQVCTIQNSTVMNQENDTTTTTTMQPDKNYMDDDDNMDIVDVAGSSTNKSLPSPIITQQQQNLKSSSASDINAKENLTEIQSPLPFLSSSTFSQPAGLEPETDLKKPQHDGAQGQVNSNLACDVHDDDDDNEVQCIEPNASNTTATPLTSSRSLNKHNYHRFQARDVNFDVVNSSPIDSPTDKCPIFKNPGVHQSQLKPDDSLSEKSSTTGVTIRKIGMLQEKKNMDDIVAPTTATTSKSTVKPGKSWEPGFIYVEARDGTVTKHEMKPLLKNEYFIAESDPLAIPDGGLDPDDDRSQSPPLLFPNNLPPENSLEKSPQDNNSPLKLRKADSRRNSESSNNDSMSPLKIISPTIQTPQKTYESCDEVPKKIKKMARSKFNQKLIEDLVRTLGRKSSMSKKSLKKKNGKKVVPINKQGNYKKKFSLPILAAPNVIPLDEIWVSKIHNNNNNDSTSSSSSSSHFNDWPQTDGQVKRKAKAGRPRKSMGPKLFDEEEEKNESLENKQKEGNHFYHQQDFSRSGRRIKKSTKFLDYELDG